MTQTTAVATRDPKPALVAGASVAAIVPRTVEEMFRLAAAIHSSGMAPASLKNSEQVMVAIMAGAELGLAPFQSLQSFAVINGRPSIWGDGLMAVVRNSGFKVREWSDGEGDALIARCEVTRPDTGEVIPGEFSVTQAKKAGLWGKQGPWQSYPARMLKMRARAFALRDGAADVLRGFQIREEAEDFIPIREAREPAPSGVMARLSQHGDASAPGFRPGEVDTVLDGDRIPESFNPEAGEITEAVIDPPADDGLPVRDDTAPPDEVFPGDLPRFDVLTWAGELTQRLPSIDDVDSLRAEWTSHKEELRSASTGLFGALNKAIAARAAEIGAKAVAE